MLYKRKLNLKLCAGRRDARMLPAAPPDDVTPGLQLLAAPQAALRPRAAGGLHLVAAPAGMQHISARRTELQLLQHWPTAASNTRHQQSYITNSGSSANGTIVGSTSLSAGSTGTRARSTSPSAVSTGTTVGNRERISASSSGDVAPAMALSPRQLVSLSAPRPDDQRQANLYVDAPAPHWAPHRPLPPTPSPPPPLNR